MYYVVYGLLYMVSLLPFWALYLISDAVHFLMYHIFGYRKKVVLANLQIAFPEKTEAGRLQIARQFYRNLIDTFIETIKLLSISKEQLAKRAQIDFSVVNDYAAQGRNIQLHTGHQMNWEYGAWALSANTSIPFLGVYMEIGNKIFERLMLKLRSQPNVIMVPKHQFVNRTHDAFKKQYAIALVADQNPSNSYKAYWLNFFGKPAPFVTGPDKGAHKFNPVVVFAKFVKLKRGFYRYEIELATDDPASLPDGELTLMYRNFLEKAIKAQPDNYLWSHRRWKHAYKDDYAPLWIDSTPPPSVQ